MQIYSQIAPINLLHSSQAFCCIFFPSVIPANVHRRQQLPWQCPGAALVIWNRTYSACLPSSAVLILHASCLPCNPRHQLHETYINSGGKNGTTQYLPAESNRWESGDVLFISAWLQDAVTHFGSIRAAHIPLKKPFNHLHARVSLIREIAGPGFVISRAHTHGGGLT